MTIHTFFGTLSLIDFDPLRLWLLPSELEGDYS